MQLVIDFENCVGGVVVGGGGGGGWLITILIIYLGVEDQGCLLGVISIRSFFTFCLERYCFCLFGFGVTEINILL